MIIYARSRFEVVAWIYEAEVERLFGIRTNKNILLRIVTILTKGQSYLNDYIMEKDGLIQDNWEQ